MPRTAWVVVCLVAVLPALPVTAAMARPSAERSIVRQINTFRASHGQRPLRPSPALSRGARRHSSHLMRADRFVHASSLRAPGHWKALGEVLAFGAGWKRRTAWAVRAWRFSPGHAGVLASGKYRRIGVGRALGRFNGRLATIWTVKVGRR